MGDEKASSGAKIKKKLDNIEKISNEAGATLSGLGDTISGSVADMLSTISAASHGGEGSKSKGQKEGAVPAIPTEGIDQFNATLEAADETMSGSMIPSINEMVNGGLLPMVGQFVALNPQVQGFVDHLALAAPSIGATISTLGEMSTTVGGAISSVQGMAEGIKTFGGSLGKIFGSGGTITLVIAAIAALVAGFLYLWNTNEEFRTAVTAIWENIKQVAMAVFQNLQAFWDEWGDEILGAFTIIWETISGVFDAALKVLSGVFKIFAGVFEGDWEKVWEGIQEVFSGVCEGIEALFSGVWKGIKEIFKGGIKFISDKLSGFMDKVKSIIGDKIISGFEIGLPDIPTLGKGGIVTGPTLAMIGEAGKEAVIPLNKLNTMINPRGVGFLREGEGLNGAVGDVSNQYNITINNPNAEPSSDSIRSTLLKHSYGLV